MSDWTYHASNFRVTTKTTSGNQQNLTYGYDNNGNVTAIGDSLFTAGRAFTYDSLNRMITATGTFGANQSQQNCNGANGFVYNEIGNLTGKCGATLSYSDTIYHPSAVTHHSGVNKSYTYDANGNMLQRGNQTLAWTIDNRVASVSIAGGGTTYMEYDSSGMRVKKDGPNGITLYPFAGYEIDPSGVITKFIRAGGETIASKRGASKRYYHNDHLGGVNVITDEAGNRCQLIEYDPWGAVSRAEGTCDPDTRFTGQKLDPETGLYYYGGRYYDAEIGRFVSADPFVQDPYDPQNLNRYSYVVNNPQTLIDPSGYFHKIKKEPSWKRIFGIVVGVVFGNAVKQIVEPVLRGDGIGVFFGLVSAVADFFGQSWVRQLLNGAHSAFYGGSFWKGYINGWSPFASSIGYDGFAWSTGGPGTDFPIQVACSFCSGLFVGNAYAAQPPSKPHVNEGVYWFPDRRYPGKVYVGQSEDIDTRLGQHIRDGRLMKGDLDIVRRMEVPGGITAREIAEYMKIQEITRGVPARVSPDVSNRRDPIGERRRCLLCGWTWRGGGDGD